MSCTEQILVAELSERYETKDRPIPKYFWNDFRKMLNSFEPHKWRSVFDHVVSRRSFKTCPAVGDFYKAAEELGLKERDNINRGPEVYYYYRCQACGTIYSMKSRGCPKCKKMTEIIVIRYLEPQPHVRLQENCFDCKIYGKQAKGPVCRDFGSSSPEDLRSCEGCLCRECCLEQRRLRAGLDRNPYKAIPKPEKIDDKEIPEDIW